MFYTTNEKPDRFTKTSKLPFIVSGIFVLATIILTSMGKPEVSGESSLKITPAAVSTTTQPFDISNPYTYEFPSNDSAAIADEPTSIKLVIPARIDSKEKLYAYMVDQGIKFPKLVWSQAMLESTWMGSDLFNRANNLFGMKKSGKRDHLQIHVPGDPYSHFENVKNCVKDYKLHQQQTLKVQGIGSEAQYLDRLKRTGYCSDPAYRKKLLSIRNSTDFDQMEQNLL